MADYSTIDPWIISTNTPAEIAFLTDVFGATPRGEPVLNPDGRVGHAEIEIGEAVIMLFDADTTKPAHLRIFVDDAAAVLAKAEAAGARVVTTPTELFWGDITARFRDPQGHLWWIAQKLDVDPAEFESRSQDPKLVKAMEYVQSSLEYEFAREG